MSARTRRAGAQAQPARLVASVVVCHPVGDIAHHAAVAELGQSFPAERFEILLSAYGTAEQDDAAPAEAPPLLANLRVLPASATFAAACDRAAAAASGEILAFLGALAVPQTGWLAGLCNGFPTFGAGISVVAGRVRPRWGAPRPSWLPDALLGALGVVDYGDEARELAAGEGATVANMAVRKDSFAAIGGVAAPDDGALLERIFAAGLRAAYAPAAAVTMPIPAEHLTQTWFRRRAAWQAARDAARAPAATPEQLVEQWDAVKQFFYLSPPAERTLRGLVLEQDDPERFRQQVQAVYDSVSCLLGGLGEPYFD